MHNLPCHQLLAHTNYTEACTYTHITHASVTFSHKQVLLTTVTPSKWLILNLMAKDLSKVWLLWILKLLLYVYSLKLSGFSIIQYQKRWFGRQHGMPPHPLFHWSHMGITFWRGQSNMHALFLTLLVWTTVRMSHRKDWQESLRRFPHI